MSMEGIKMSACKACMAAIIWIKTPAGNPSPVMLPRATTSKSRASAVRKLSLGTGKCFRANIRKAQPKQPAWAMCRIGNLPLCRSIQNRRTQMKEMVYISDPNADREILDEGYVHGYHYCIVSLGSHPCAMSRFPKTTRATGLTMKRSRLAATAA